MGTRPNQGSSRNAAGGWFRVAILLVPGFVACVSEPCVGDACPDACNGVACEEEGAPDAASNGGGTPGRFTPCDSDASCDRATGFECVEGLCRHPCRSHFDCGGVAICEPLGSNGTYCALTDPPTEPGGYYSTCPNGSCDEARGFICIGAGIADTNSFCSATCDGDGDCPPGFFCDAVANTTGAEQKRCVPQGFCSACETDADCLAVPGGVCAVDASGEKRCTTICDPGRNSCPWGGATECRITDENLGVPTCQHKFGACRGEGLACEPCVRDDDCRDSACIESFYTGERWCIDRTAPCSCEGLPTRQEFCSGPETGCGASPGGLPMVCYDPDAPGNGVCLGVNLPTATVGPTQLSCWR